MPATLKLLRTSAALMAGLWLLTPPLFAGYYRTQGNRIVDANGHPAVLHGINWFGFETANFAPHGLWSRSMSSYLDQMQALGYTFLRIPYCNQMFDAGVMPNGIDYYSNPDLQGLTPLQVLDKLVQRAGARGMKIMLDRHRPDSSAQSELWYTSTVSEQRWINDWQMLAQHYAGNDTVIAADLHNEPHGSATWGSGTTNTDWRLAAERCGNAILSVNPNWLIVVEGVETVQTDAYWWGGNLKGAAAAPVRLSIPNRLVYSPHDYGPGVFAQPWFSDPNFPRNLPGVWSNHWAYLHLQGTAPILVGEFGGHSVDTVSQEGRWQNALVDYIATNQMYWTYWCWNPNSGDTGGVLNDDWTTINTNKQNMLNRLINASTAPPPPAPAAPTGLNAAALSTSQIRLTWTDQATNEAGFRIERSLDGQAFSPVATTLANLTVFTDNNLAAAATYYYRVCAYNDGGDSAFSNTNSATTLAPVLEGPTNLTAAALSATRIDLAWSESITNENGFLLERSSDGSHFTLLATLAPNATHFTDTNVQAAAAYFYRVRAFNNAGESVDSNLARATAPVPNALSALAAADFEANAPGRLTGQAGGFGWGGNWTVNIDTNKVLVTQAGPALVAGTVNGAARALQFERSMYNETLATRSLAAGQAGDDLYVSFLYRRAGGAQDDSITLWLGNKSGPAIGLAGNQFTISPSAGVAALSPLAIQATSNYFVVGHFFKTAGGAVNPYDGAELWVNPTGGLRAPQARVTGLTTNSLASFQTLGIKVWGTSENDTNLFDRIVLGTRWADVVPAALGTASFEDNSLNGLNGQSGGDGWADPWLVSVDLSKVNVVAPVPPQAFATADAVITGGAQALELRRAMYNDNLLRRDLIATAGGDDVYVAFLYRKTAGALNETLWLWLGNKAGPALGLSGNKFQVRTAENLATSSSTVILSGLDYFVVGHFSKSASGPTNLYDHGELWVNPTHANLTAPDAAVSGSTTNSLGAFGTLGLAVSGAADDDACLLDHLALGTRWSEVAPMAAPRFVSWGWNGSRQFCLSFAGDTAASFHVWASSNLCQWEDMGPAEVGAVGLFQFTDLSASNRPQRFYRAISGD